MNKMNKCLFSTILILSLIFISAVSADDLNNTEATTAIDNGDVDLQINHELSNVTVSEGNNNTSLGYAGNHVDDKCADAGNSSNLVDDSVNTIHNMDEFEHALNNGGNYTVANDFTIDSSVSKDCGGEVFINGNGHTIHGDDSKYRDVDIDKSKVYFENCVFDKVRIVASIDVSLYNCTIQNTYAGYYRDGAAISAKGNKLIVNNCSILNCGSEDGYHGAFFLKECQANITNTYFENCFGVNSGTCDDEGGAIFSKDTILNLSNCIFKDCHARDDGGAVHILRGNAAIFNCSFIGCHADSYGVCSSYGGAVYIKGPTSIINCNFTNCSATGRIESRWMGAIDHESHDTYFKVVNCSINGKRYDSSSISNVDDLKNAFDLGGNYTLINDITITGDISKSSSGNVDINGNGHTIYSDDSKYRDIDIENGRAYFMNCIFDKVRIDASSDVSLYKCTIQNTHAGNYGDAAAIYASDCKLTLNDCRIANCNLTGGYHGAVFLTNVQAEINNTYFEHCVGTSASMNNGGAIYSKNSRLNLTNSKFSVCDIHGDGGAIHTTNGVNFITNCSFDWCTAFSEIMFPSYGAAIYVKGTTYITNCTFLACSATSYREPSWQGVIDRDSWDIKMVVENCVIDWVKYDSYMIHDNIDFKNALNTGGNYTLVNDITISDLSKSYGGEVHINGNGHKIRGDDDKYCDIDVNVNKVYFENCVFDKIRIDASKDVSLYNCTIQNTRTGVCRECAAIYASDCKVTLNGCNIINCGSNNGYHGAIYFKNAKAEINNTYFKECFGANSDGGGVIYSKDTNLKLNNCKFENCYSRGCGGAVYTYGGDSSIVNCSFIGCHADSSAYGDAVYARGTTSIIDCNFTDCYNAHHIDPTWEGAIDRYDYNIHLDVNNSSINNTVLTIHNAFDFENALNTGGRYTLVNDITIHDLSKSTGCEVHINGNGHKIHGDDDKYCDIDVEANKVYFENCVFDKVRIDASSEVSLYNCTIQNVRTGTWRYGAAISAQGCKISVDHCRIINCGSHSGYHGAVYLKNSQANITNTYFENCFGVNSWTCDDEGGAIFSKDSTLDLSNSVFERCHAHDDGGAVYILDGSSKINNCSFIECHAESSSYGGAIYVKGTTSIKDCNFTKCSAEKSNENYGGAIDRSSSSIYWDVDNCIIIK